MCTHSCIFLPFHFSRKRTTPAGVKLYRRGGRVSACRFMIVEQTTKSIGTSVSGALLSRNWILQVSEKLIENGLKIGKKKKKRKSKTRQNNRWLIYNALLDLCHLNIDRRGSFTQAPTRKTRRLSRRIAARFVPIAFEISTATANFCKNLTITQAELSIFETSRFSKRGMYVCMMYICIMRSRIARGQSVMQSTLITVV